MQNASIGFIATFKSRFNEGCPPAVISSILRQCGPRRRRPAYLSQAKLIQSLVFHSIRNEGTLSQHVKELTGKNISDAALSERRALLPGQVFERMMSAALKPKADPSRHPDAFQDGLRLCGLDGTTFSVSNTPQVKKLMRKAKARRGRAAFPKVGSVVMVELGLRNPLAAAVGPMGNRR